MTVNIVLTIIMIFKKIDNLSLNSKYSFLADFLNDLDKFIRLKTQKEKNKGKKTNV